MKLNYVHIKNFRSIEDVKIDLNPACRVLVGINESGKSNVLKALSSLGDYMPSKTDDVRESLPDEDPIEESSVGFGFTLNKEETEDLFGEVSEKILSRDLAKSHIVKVRGKETTLKAFVELRNKGLYDVDILAQKKAAKYWTIENQYELLPDWKKPSEACPADFQIELKNGEKTLLKTTKLVRRADFPDVPEEYFASASIKELVAIVGEGVIDAIKENLPDTLFWEYTEKNLLPGSISLDDFIANPYSCLPLKNMFALAGIDDIPKAITDARGKSRNSLHNFFKAISDKATSHFRSVWKEHKTLEFELMPDGGQLIPGVREKNRYDFAKRSDGFKRFVSFLLLISAKVKSGTLSDTLLLIDEPDISLHPSGARYLRDELIRISKTNYVIYSTHSIFMIDREDIGRHIIVTKKNEKTNVSVANDSNIVDEEVIYNALGYSIFENLKKKNIIFEGWKDKHLFEIAIKKLPSTHTTLKQKFKDVGTCHAKGVKHIKSITPIMEMAQRDCLIISDADAPAKEKQSEYAAFGGYGVWKRYDEVVASGANIITGEDFLKIDVFRAPIKEVRGRYSGLPEFNELKMADSQGKIYAISQWLCTGGLDTGTRDVELKKIKDKVFADLKVADIEEFYFDFLVKLAELL